MLRIRYIVKGQVQGVGFRPFVYKLATGLEVGGFVRNNEWGVEIEIEGEEKKVIEFENLFFENLPPLARVDEFSKKRVKPLSSERFSILESVRDFNYKAALIPPDIRVCSDCLKDIFVSLSRYDKYFSTNCTNCGPRYSIIKTVPYDRKNTSMNRFKMCDECQKEYDNPLSRRYHAQPISCKNCGPVLSWKDMGSRAWNDFKENDFKIIAEKIKDGEIGAVKGIGGFHIVCDATNTQTIEKLRKYKNRPTKPFAIMCKNLKQIKSFAKVTKKEEEFLESKEAPIVLLKTGDNPNSTISYLSIAPAIDRIGCMLPYTPFHFLLFEFLENPIVATSANLSGEPIITDANEIEEKLPFLDFIVDFDRDIVNAVDDSVIQVVNDDIMILRLARGYAPKVLKLPKKTEKNILAVGANQKSTISLAFENNLILSPYIADLDSIKSMDYFKRTIKTFERFYDFKPDMIVYDKHPNYESSKFAKKLKTQNSKLKTVAVQHHLAHLFSVKAEYGLTGSDFTGFVFDGTGLGDDGILWGGEVFVKEKRKYFFKPIKLIGGEKAIKECYRVALSMLFERYTLDEILDFDLKYKNISMLYQMWQKDINSPKSSSVGRLFDGVASLSGLCDVQTYEGEAGLLSESKVSGDILDIKESFDFVIKDGLIDIKWDFFDKNLVKRFYATLVSVMIDIATKEDLPVLLSGGVFQNKTLTEFVLREFKKKNITCYYNKNIPVNDSGVSVGQIWNILDI